MPVWNFSKPGCEKKLPKQEKKQLDLLFLTFCPCKGYISNEGISNYNPDYYLAVAMFVATKLAHVSYGETAFSGHKYDQTLIQSVQRADEENKREEASGEGVDQSGDGVGGAG